MPKSSSEKRWTFIVNITYFSIIIGLIYLFFKYALMWLMPFVIGFILASAANPIVTRITDKVRINRKLCAFLVILLEYLLIGAFFWIVIAKVISSAQSVFTDLPVIFDNDIVPMWDKIYGSFIDTIQDWPPEVMQHVSSFTSGAFESLRELISGVSEHFLSFLADSTAQIPFLFLSVIFTVLASFFISMDYEKIKTFVKKILPHKVSDVISDTKLQLGRTLLNYAKAYGIIMLITFVELLIGLAILGVDNILGISAIIAVFDILPVLGTGGILIPWSLFQLITGNYFMGIGLLVLYLITVIVRNFIEPKIIGMHLGLHPLVTLIAIYVGYQILGVLGMIILPVCITILLALNNTGRLKIWPLTVMNDNSDKAKDEPTDTDANSESEDSEETDEHINNEVSEESVGKNSDNKKKKAKTV